MTDAKANEYLLEFFKAWLDWATAGGKQHPAFLRVYGLCWNLDSFLIEYHRYLVVTERRYIKNHLAEMLEEEFGDSQCPFDTSLVAYNNEKNCHANPKRKEWVLRKIKELSKKREEVT